MDRNEMLWNKFTLSGKIDDYLNYCTNKKGKEKAERNEYGRPDNQRENRRRTE